MAKPNGQKRVKMTIEKGLVKKANKNDHTVFVESMKTELSVTITGMTLRKLIELMERNGSANLEIQNDLLIIKLKAIEQ